MQDALSIHRFHFAFTITFHYIFPQLTMGLALLLVILKTLALRTKDEKYNRAVRFWARIFAINFAMGVVTGIPYGISVRHKLGGLFLAPQAESSGKLSPWKEFFLFLPSNRVFLGPYTVQGRKTPRPTRPLVRNVFWFLWARGFPDISSWRRTHGCNIPSHIR